MPIQNPIIYINLPVADLSKAITFYEAMGFSKNPKFSNDQGAMMSIGPSHDHPAAADATNYTFPSTINVMVQTHEFFQTFQCKGRGLVDTTKANEVLLCVSAWDRDSVDAIIEAASQAGGEIDPSRKQDHAYMYGRSFADLDGHIWEVVWMIPSSMPDGES